MSKYFLTEKQHGVYTFIKDYMERNNRSPYIREIQEGCGISSYKGAIDKLMALERKGYIKRRLNKHRNIALNKG